MKLRTSPLLIFILLASASSAQDPHKVPFASRGNVLELAVQNASGIAGTDLTIEATDVPLWLELSPQTRRLSNVGPFAEASVSFEFSVEKTAPVLAPAIVRLLVRNASGEEWVKEVTIEVLPPESYELYQNYPNPFNPTTTIAYQLAAPSDVRLSIYNVLGQEVARPVEGRRTAGFFRQVWNAAGFASGMYVYELEYTDASSKHHTIRKSLMVLK